MFHPFWHHFSDDAFGFSMKEALTLGLKPRTIYLKEMEIHPLLIYEGPPIYHGLLLYIKNVKEKYDLELHTQRKERLNALGEMSAILAHEIKNPLGGIRGFAALLQRDLKDSPHLQEMVQCIIDGTRSLEKIVSAILQYAKPIQPELQTLDLSTYLRKLIQFIQVDPALTKAIKIKQHIPNDPILTPFDPDLLKGALFNLIFNAIQAMPQGGDLIISLLKVENTCQISITDTGIGMSEELLENLFSPFFTTKKRGNGLGLVEIKKVVQAHLGSIEVRSQLHRGTTFTIKLPLKR